MKIQCPKCSAIQEAKKDDLMGRIFVCRSCHHTFSWESQVLPGKSAARPKGSEGTPHGGG